MGVVSSSYAVEAHTQVDGRKYVVETHTLNVGEPVVIQYLAAVGADYAAILSARVATINEQLAEAEAAALMDAD